MVIALCSGEGEGGDVGAVQRRLLPPPAFAYRHLGRKYLEDSGTRGSGFEDCIKVATLVDDGKLRFVIRRNFYVRFGSRRLLMWSLFSWRSSRASVARTSRLLQRPPFTLRLGKPGPERERNLRKVTQRVGDRPRARAWGFKIQSWGS